MVYQIEKLTIRPICMLWLKEIEGLENIPKDKPFIIAANHTSYYDGFLVPSVIAPEINKKLHALVYSYYWKFFLTRYILDLWESIPVYLDKEEDSKERNKLAISKSVKYLRNKELVMIFPEGGRSADGRLGKAYNGVARICLESKVPVLPVGIIDAHKVLPVGKVLPRFKRCKVKIGKLMYFNNKKMNNKALGEVTKEIMKSIGKLIGQKYNH